MSHGSAWNISDADGRVGLWLCKNLSAAACFKPPVRESGSSHGGS